MNRTDESGWIEWEGGAECPVAPDTLIQFRLRGESLDLAEGWPPGPASDVSYWDHYGDLDDVIAYRIVPSQEGRR